MKNNEKLGNTKNNKENQGKALKTQKNNEKQ